MIDISIYLNSVLVDVVTAAVVPSLNLELREVPEVALLIVLHHSRGGIGSVVSGTSRQDHRFAQVDRAGLAIIIMFSQKKTNNLQYILRAIT